MNKFLANKTQSASLVAQVILIFGAILASLVLTTTAASLGDGDKLSMDQITELRQLGNRFGARQSPAAFFFLPSSYKRSSGMDSLASMTYGKRASFYQPDADWLSDPSLARQYNTRFWL